MTKLSQELAAYSEMSAAHHPDFSTAYDRLVDRLTALDRGEVGPKLGERIPPFTLPDTEGRLVALEALLQSGPVVMSFNRGHWCPYCRMDLRSLAAEHNRIRRLGGHVVSIMPDRACFTARYARENELPFPVLSDTDLGYSLLLGLIFWVGPEIERLYREAGVALDTYHGNDAFLLPMAAKFIVGQDGTVKARQVNLEFRTRMDPDEIVAVLEELRG
jgi:peroxiredoxin